MVGRVTVSLLLLLCAPLASAAFCAAGPPLPRQVDARPPSASRALFPHAYAQHARLMTGWNAGRGRPRRRFAASKGSSILLPQRLMKLDASSAATWRAAAYWPQRWWLPCR